MTSRPRTDGKLPLTELADMKSRGEPIVMVTAYDYPSGRIADAAGIDLVLVGDSAAMTVLGNDSTVPATMDEMLMLTRAAARGAERPLVVADMPFGSFQVSDEEAVRNGIRFVKEAGADAVKLEGAGPTLSRALALVGAGIPVMGHVGLTPQSATMLGGFRAQGRTADKARALLQDARALEAAGCFTIVLEAVPAQVAARITESLTVPTIGIGSGRGCDGQVLVFHDLLGLYDGKAPRFVKRYADLATRDARPPSSATPPMCARARSPATSTRTPFPRTSSPPSRPPSAARERNQERKRDDQEPEHDEPDRNERAHCGPALDHRDPVDEQAERPEADRSQDRLEDDVARAIVPSAAPEEVRAVDGDSDGPDEDEAEDERRGREREDVPRAQVAPLAPGTAEAHVERGRRRSSTSPSRRGRP